MTDENGENNNCKSENDAASWVLDFLNSPEENNEVSLPDTFVETDPAARPSAHEPDYNGLKIYQESLLRFQAATASENRALLKNWRDFGSESAMVRLIEGNLHLVISVARFYAGFYPEVDEQDLITIGYDGLRSAVEHFDSGEETPFNSYASFLIKQAIQRYIIKNINVVYIPGNRRILLRQLESYFNENKLKVRTFDELPFEHRNKIMQVLKISERTLKSLFRIPLAKQLDLHSSYLLKNGRTTSLLDFCKQIKDDSDTSFQGEYQNFEKRLHEAISKLESRESLIIKLRFGLFSGPKYLTLEEVSQRLGRTRERIRQIEQKALRKLKSLLAAAYEEYLKSKEPTHQPQLLNYEIITTSSDDLLHALCDIFDFEQIPLTLGEIRQRLKQFHAGRFISDQVLHNVLKSHIFSKYESQTGENMWQLNTDSAYMLNNAGESADENSLSIKEMDFDENMDLMLEKDNDLSILYMGDLSDDLEDEEATELEDLIDTKDSADDIIKMFSF